MRIKLSIPLALGEIRRALGAPASANDGRIITAISTDSRLARADDLFVAIKGERYDGTSFIKDAARSGAVTAGEKYADIMVSSGEQALLSLSALYKRKLPLKHTAAITGSCGKTTTREICTHIMKHSFKVHSTKDNQNNAIGVSYTVLSAPKDTEILLLEAGMNHASELSQISRAITPSIAAITNVGSAHIGNFGSVRNIAAAKLEITHGMTGGTLLLPFGDPYLHFLPSKTVSASDKRADICLIPKRTSHHETDYSFLSRGAFVTKFHSTITGAHIPPCLAFAVAVANESGIPAEVIAEAVSVLKCDDLSRSTVRHLGYIDVIDDSYNSSPEAVKTALKTLDLYEHKSKSVLLGDMLELGAMCEKLHFLVGCEAARHKINKLYAVGTYASYIANGALSQGFPKESIVVHKGYEEYGELAEKIKKNSVYGELLLVKGSHAVHLCELIKLL